MKGLVPLAAALVAVAMIVGGAAYLGGDDQAPSAREGGGEPFAERAQEPSAARIAQRPSPPDHRPSAPPHHRPPPLFWGAQIGDQLTGEAAPWDMRAVARFERISGKKLSLISFSAPFADCRPRRCRFFPFPFVPLRNVRAYGAIPFFNWSSEGSLASHNDPAFRLSRIVNGTYDSYIRNFAEAAARWKHPFFLRFDWEMNGDWFPWGAAVNGNRPGDYVAAWRHVHDIFSAVGATNATWVWCPNADFTGKLEPLRPLYPGDAYVDWTCIDAFNWGETAHSPRWLSFQSIFEPTYRRILAISPHKPIIIGEVASDTRGGSKRRWITEMLRTLPNRFPKVRGLIWFEKEDRGLRWSLTQPRAAARVFARQIRRPIYRPNLYGRIAASPIPPPRR